MKAVYKSTEVFGESKEHCIVLIKESLGRFDNQRNQIILAEIDEREVEFILSGKDKKMDTDYKGTSISLTSKDALALMQIQAGFQMGQTRTVFKFENGTRMELTPSTFQDFAAFFVAERNKFFQE